MDKTKSKLATSNLSTFFDHGDEDNAFHSTVDDAKLSQYTAGVIRKSRREKEQEAAESKRREEEADAAKVYADFIAAFEGEGSGRKAGTGFVNAQSKDTYAPVAKPIPSGPRGLRKSPSPSNAPKPKGKRAMDAFLEEIKKEQAQREEKYSLHAHGHGRSITALAAYDSQSGSKDRGDPKTSNVFVANLPSSVTEESLGNFFARVGPVGSVKIMWPRGDAGVGPGADMTASRRTKNSGLSGFVSFMTRRDAEDALREFDGYEWQGSVLRVGWSKAVPIAAKPKYVSTKSNFKDRTRDSSSPPPRRSSRSRDRSDRSRSRSPARHRFRSRSPRRRNRFSGSRSRSHSPSRSPIGTGLEEIEVTDTFIRAIAAEVRGHGADYEARLVRWETNNPKFAFIRRSNRRNGYYRELVSDRDFNEPEFDDEGYNSVYSTDSAEESERERTHKAVLGRLAKRRLEAMIRALSGKRGEIARCMAFCLEHAEAANEIADIIIVSLLVDETPVPRKMARLYLICDILHNGAASLPSAWKYRQEFQGRLGVVFDHLGNIYRSFPGRITADVFKKQITAVIDLWEDWIIFPLEFLAELRRRLDDIEETKNQPTEQAQVTQVDSQTYTSRFKTSSFQAAEGSETLTTTLVQIAPKSISEGGIGVVPLREDVAVQDDLDGEPMEDDINGVPMDDDVDGVPMDDDIDGIPMEDDIDGVPMEDDIDGMPMEENK